ncbi:amidohydrolase family protein [Flagellimonas sp. W118]|uniref:amidohydrolase family protein n=1 Tax=Flagellimonas sp. W118 TaxID=3410791 RepID=UPI003BF5808C
MSRYIPVLILFFLSVSDSHSQEGINEIIIKNTYLIDGNGSNPELKSIKIVNGIITEIEKPERLLGTENAFIIDGSDRYLIPGLIDSHVHLMIGGDENGQKELLFKMLKTGVTTVQDLVGDARDLAYYSKQQKRGLMKSPEVYFSAMFTTADFMKKDFRMGMFPEGQNGELPFLQAVDENTDFKKAIARAHGTGATAIKLYAGLSENIIKNLTNEAHEMGLKVWCHPAQFPQTAQDIVEIDIDVFCHAGLLAYTSQNAPSEYHIWFKKLYDNDHYDVFPESLEVDTILNTMLEHNTILDATLVAWKYSDKGFELATKIIKRAHELGVKITTGTDIQGFPTLEELYLLVEVVGLSPKEALISSSKNGAEAIGIEKTHGTIEVGKVANLLLLNENPLINIRNVQKIDKILINGNVVD